MNHTQAEREFDWETGRELERKDAEIMWLRSSVVSLLTLAEAKPSPLTNDQVASICRVTLAKFWRMSDTDKAQNK